VLVIAHRLSTIVNADLICVMEKGQIVERGSHDQLIRLGGRYAGLWSQQAMQRKTSKAIHT
jgi:ABC-type transport system involved in Fe-S cluster assembly fused permease/ATPase subunit